MRILIVDDSNLLRDRIREAIFEIDNTGIVDEATNGIEALKMIHEKKPDFIVLDIRMPKMSGISVLEKMKEQNIKTTVCIFTNHPSEQYMQACIKRGADNFLDKNKDFNALIKLIECRIQNNLIQGD